MAEKKCTKCSEIKALSEFNKLSRSKDGFRSECRDCEKMYRRNNKDQIRQYKQNYYQENRYTILEKQRDYYEHNRDDRLDYYYENRDHYAQYKVHYYEKNKEKLTERSRDYAKTNPERIRAAAAKRRFSVDSTATSDPWELSQIAQFYADCPDNWQVDHIIPLARGGCHTLDNLQHLEAWMNNNKRAKHPDDWNDPRPISCRA